MSMLDDDLAAVHADALTLGMADTVTYTPLVGTASTIVGTFSETPEPFIHDNGAETQRRSCMFSCTRSDVPNPTKGDTVTAASGAYAGTWTVTDAGTGDDGGWVIPLRLDERTKMGTGRRMP